MKQVTLLIALCLFSAAGLFAQTATPTASAENPFFQDWATPFQTPAFPKVTLEHFLPGIEEGIKRQKAEIDAITASSEAPSFPNTIEAMEKSGTMLKKVSDMFFNLNSAHTNDDMQKMAKEIAPMLAKHNDDINLNEKLFARVKEVFTKKETFQLNTEQHKVLKDTYDNFIRGGANLAAEKKEIFRKNNEELSVLAVKFGENLLKETNAVALVIEDKADLAGLPEHVIQAAAETAKAKGHEGKWAFTLQKPSFIPFLQYAEKRDLREKLFKAYVNRGNNNNEFDNKKVLARIAALRVEQANLLGYKTHADFILEKNMAKDAKKVQVFLNDLWTPALKRAAQEIADMQKIIDAGPAPFRLAAWDWWYYAEKVKKEKYDLDEAMLRPYFKLENVFQGVLELTTRLYGLKYVERPDIPTYHPDVKAYEVQEADGKHLAVLFTDYFPRDSKRSGAWMNSYRKQSNIANQFVTPVISNVGNFSKPTADKPSLLSLDEVNTLFHEFGHALHGIFSKSTYPSVTGTAVARDFVELPSQIMENWALHPEVLKLYARHYQTNEPIPDSLIKKIENSRRFNQGFETVEYLAAAFLDLEWHTLVAPEVKDVAGFEQEALKKIGKISEIESRYQSTNFQHIFAGGYSSGYYSYIWAGVLDADAFEAFVEKGIFDKAVAAAFRTHILEKGGSDEAMVLYKNFRGREPKVDALLKRKGLN